MNITDIAKVAHEVNRAYCKSIGDYSQPSWFDAPEWMKKSAINGAEFHMSGDYGPEASHENWLKEKTEDGWIYGEEKNSDLKTHPCCVPFSDLPEKQKTKDFIFREIVHSLQEFLCED